MAYGNVGSVPFTLHCCAETPSVGLTSYRSIIKNSFDDAVVFSLDHPSGMIIATISQHTIHDHHRELLKAGV